MCITNVFAMRTCERGCVPFHTLSAEIVANALHAFISFRFFPNAINTLLKELFFSF